MIPTIGLLMVRTADDISGSDGTAGANANEAIPAGFAK
jgi:hypothetical protein